MFYDVTIQVYENDDLAGGEYVYVVIHNNEEPPGVEKEQLIAHGTAHTPETALKYAIEALEILPVE